ncbi:MAG: hypothetical protein ACJA0P_001191 [Planctomycetota bacterium]
MTVRGLVLGLAALVLPAIAVRQSLQTVEHAGTEPVLDAIAALVDHPSIDVFLPAAEVGDDEAEAALRLAALRLASTWRSMGHPCRVRPLEGVNSYADAEDAEDAAGARVICSSFPEEPKLWSALGLVHDAGKIQTPGGRAWPEGSVAIAVTLVRGQTQRHGLASPESRISAVGCNIHVIGKEPRGEPVASALEALARRRPQLTPTVVLWCKGQRVYEATLNSDGWANDDGTAWGLAAPSTPTGDEHASLLGRARRISAAIEALKPAGEPASQQGAGAAGSLHVHEASSLASRERDGAVQRAGWYDGVHHRLVMLRGVPAGQDDALFAFAEAEFLRVLGAPGTEWFSRGMAHNLIGSCGGMALGELEKRAGAVTPDEVFGPGRGRTRLTLAPAEARLARAMVAEYGGSVTEAWGVQVERDAGLRERLRERWMARLVQASTEPDSMESWATVPRVLPPGAHVELAVRMGSLAQESVRSELERVARLGFAGVSLRLHVPVAPATALERRYQATGWQAWGSHVSMEGDGAVLATAAIAKELGLSVTLAPRFLTGESAGLGRRQIHGGAEQLRRYGDRRALAMEGAAWLAEQAGADALVALDGPDLPLPPSDPVLPPEVVAARANLRRQTLVYSSPFAGERIVFAGDQGLALVALQSLGAGFSEGALGHVHLRVGHDALVDVNRTSWLEALRRLDAQDGGQQPGAVFVGTWFAERPGGSRRDLGAAPDAWLRKLSDAGVVPGPR